MTFFPTLQKRIIFTALNTVIILVILLFTACEIDRINDLEDSDIQREGQFVQIDPNAILEIQLGYVLDSTITYYESIKSNPVIDTLFAKNLEYALWDDTEWFYSDSLYFMSIPIVNSSTSDTSLHLIGIIDKTVIKYVGVEGYSKTMIFQQNLLQLTMIQLQ